MASVLPPARPPLLKTIPEREQEEEDKRDHSAAAAPPPPPADLTVVEHPTPTKKIIHEVVSYNKCGAFIREKRSSAASGGGGGAASGSSIFKSVFSSLNWASPHLSSCSAASSYASSAKEEEWKLAATQLSYKLVHAVRKRDEAVSEAARLKNSVAELEKKITSLEIYSRELKSTLERHHRPAIDREFPLKAFLHAVSDARAAVRVLHRSLSVLTSQPGSGGGAAVPQLEGLLSRVFYEDFETAAFKRGVAARYMDPRRRAEANLAAYENLREISWGDVLSKGTRHYSEGFSRFCDRKMGEVAGAVIGGSRSSWPEPLLKAFFAAAKGVWLVHLLAWCGHPPVIIFRAEKGAPFEGEYMEEVAEEGEAARRPPATVSVMVAPGFYLLDGVIKCRVVCGGAVDGRRKMAGAGVAGRRREEEMAHRARRR